MKMSAKKKVVLLSVLGIFLLIGSSYAIWQLNFTQDSSNTLSVACFSVTYSEQDNISLANTYPMLDSEGSSLTPYQVTIKNNCNEYGAYQVNLEVLNTTTLDSGKVKIMFDEGTPKLLTSYTAVEKTLSNATSAYKMTRGFLQPNEEKTYLLRLWLDENVTLEDHVEGKRFASKITIANTYKANAPTSKDECELIYGEGAAVCNIIAIADPNNNKCLHTDENGMITDYNSSSDTPIVCEMEDDYGTSYYLRGLHTNNNVKFANSCWKIIRTTGTGGIKMIYNGDLDANGKCTSTSANHTGFTGQTLSLSGNKIYGTSYTKEGSTYTLSDTSALNWSIDADNIIGKYTCGNTSSSCTALYAVTGKYDATQAYAVKLDQSTNCAQIGTSAIYASYESPAYVGYMFNDVYTYNSKNLSSDSNNYYYGGSFSYNANSSRPYTLTDTVQLSDISDSSNQLILNSHHYTCFYTTDNTCDELFFIYYLDGTRPYYIKLQGNETVSDALDKMLRNDNINVNDSHIKGVIDWWYKTNILGTAYESKIEDTAFCNDRTIDQLSGWSEGGTLIAYLQFNAYNNKYYLKCPNKRDAFTVSDTTTGNGSLDYPIGIITATEGYLAGNSSSRNTGANYWTLGANSFYKYAVELRVATNGDFGNLTVRDTIGVRPSISLKPGTKFVAGTDGTASNPYEVDMNS